MKRIFAFALIGLLLCGCAGPQTPAPTTDPTTFPTTVPTTAPTTTPTTVPTTAPTTVPTTAPTEPPVLYRHPLTGQPLNAPWSGHIAAVMVNNIKNALPQSGLSQADVIYEMEEEGSITRNMVLFSDLSNVGAIGSIRSTRTYFVSVAAAYDAYLVHCGLSNHASGGKYDYYGNRISAWKHLDQFYNGGYFYRDSERYNKGYAWEHTLFTTGELLQKAIGSKAQSNPGKVFEFGKDIDLNGEPANTVTVTFKGKKTTTFTYDAATGLYTHSQFGAESVDEATNQTVKVKNVIALYTRQWTNCSCSVTNHQFYDTIGSGKGYAAINGKIVPITWQRASVNDPYTYLLADGTPLQLEVGTTYIAIVGEKHPISYQ